MLIYVPLPQIDDNPFQARREYGDVAELAADIMRHQPTRPDTRGLQQVPTARLVGDDGELVPVTGLDAADWLIDGRLLAPGWRVQLEFGHRRQRAFAHLAERGLPDFAQMPLLIRDLDEVQMLDGVWQENRSRRDLSAVEEAELLQAKLARASSQREVAEAWGLDRSTVANRLRLLELPEEIQQANREGKISERSALALASVVQIQKARPDPSADWGKTYADWGAPVAPGDFIQRAISDPKMTSDAIRDYAKRALQHAGVQLPSAIADMIAPQGGEIIAASCSGCSKRINSTCLSLTCLAAKKEALKASVIEEAADVLGIPFSDRREDFEIEMALRPALLQLWNTQRANPLCNFVYGWVLGYSGYRPFGNGSAGEYAAGGDLWEGGDVRRAIMLGHRGFLPVHLLEASDGGAANVEERPSPEMVDAWEKEAKRALKLAIGQAHGALVEELSMRLDDRTLDIIQALVRRANEDWLCEHEEQVLMAVQHLLQFGSGAVRHIYDALDLEKLRVMLSRAGLDAQAILTTGTRATDLRRQGVVALDYWYRWCLPRGWTHNQARPLLVAALEAFDTAAPFAESDEEYTALHHWLRAAKRSLEARSKEEQQA